mmetsp:Transcript_60234/g.196850  ORF Transcript_60234/g.196850 Transcript_60234/m.196850 type:complete len:392 (+) Transcript_60234:37-1212(+)
MAQGQFDYILNFGALDEGAEPKDPLSDSRIKKELRSWGWALPCFSATKLGCAFRMYFLSGFVEAGAVAATFALHRVRLALLLVLLAVMLRCALIRTLLRDRGVVSGMVKEIKRAQEDIKFRVGTIAVLSLVLAVGSLFEMLSERDAVSAWLAAWHTLTAVHSGYFSWCCRYRLVQHFVAPTKLWSRPFAALEAGAKERCKEDVCSICLSEYEENDVVVLLTCRHLFHTACVSQWLRNSDQCPMRCAGAELTLPSQRPATSAFCAPCLYGKAGVKAPAREAAGAAPQPAQEDAPLDLEAAASAAAAATPAGEGAEGPEAERGADHAEIEDELDLEAGVAAAAAPTEAARPSADGRAAEPADDVEEAVIELEAQVLLEDLIVVTNARAITVSL